MIAELQVRREGSVGWIVFSNPSKHNAVTYDMIVRLPDAVAQHERDPQVRVIAFRGAGEQVFVSGADVTEFGRTRGSIAATTTYNQAMENVYRAIIAARKLLLSAMEDVKHGREPRHRITDPAANRFPHLMVISEVIPASEHWKNLVRQRAEEAGSSSAATGKDESGV